MTLWSCHPAFSMGLCLMLGPLTQPSSSTSGLERKKTTQEWSPRFWSVMLKDLGFQAMPMILLLLGKALLHVWMMLRQPSQLAKKGIHLYTWVPQLACGF
uniref:Uncharacterized protein n=1 Tax=Anguilla anguilla TaxID=7936 RepID=A0A0E9XHD3_ANGAN